jgi:hypothetical protein
MLETLSQNKTNKNFQIPSADCSKHPLLWSARYSVTRCTHNFRRKPGTAPVHSSILLGGCLERCPAEPGVLLSTSLKARKGPRKGISFAECASRTAFFSSDDIGVHQPVLSLRGRRHSEWWRPLGLSLISCLVLMVGARKESFDVLVLLAWLPGGVSAPPWPDDL